MSIIRAITNQTYYGQLIQNVMHFRNPDGALSNLACKNEIFGNLWTVLKSNTNQNLIYSTMSIQQIDPTTTPAEVFTIGPNTGSLIGGGYASFAAVLFSIRTNSPGRHGHGRFYMCGIHGDWVANGLLRADVHSLLAGNATTITGRFKDGGTGPLALGVCPRNDPASFIPMSALICRQVLGVQRRRNLGVGG